MSDPSLPGHSVSEHSASGPLEGHAPGAHGTLRSYLVGFLLSVVLTGIAFALVMVPVLPREANVAVIFTLAAVQIVVQLVYFLHLDRSLEQRWNVSAVAFTVVVVGILIGGSVWIMINIGHQMMPPTMSSGGF